MSGKMKKRTAVLTALMLLLTMFVSAEGLPQLLEQETGSPAQHLTIKAEYKGSIVKIKNHLMKFTLPEGWGKKEAGEGNLLTAYDKENANSLIIEEIRGFEATEEELLAAFSSDPELSKVQEVFINGIPFIHYVSAGSDLRGFITKTGYKDRVLIFKFEPASDPAFTAQAEQIMSTLSRVAKAAQKPEVKPVTTPKPAATPKPDATPKPVKPGAPKPSNTPVTPATPAPLPALGVKDWSELLSEAKAGNTEVYIGANLNRGEQDTAVFNNPVKIKSSNGEQFILDGNGKQILVVEKPDGTAVSGTSEISGLKFVNGKADTGKGGAVYVNGDLVVTDSEFTGNSAINGGAIAVTGDLSVTDTTITNNSAAKSGGGVFSYNGDITISGDSIISDNTGTNRYSGYSDGGGVSTENGNILIEGNSVIKNNSAYWGGGVHSYYGDITVTDNAVISGNTATSSNGGGIAASYGNVTITGNATITGNTAVRGGGILADEGNVTVSGTDLMVYDNTASSIGNEMHANTTTIDPGTVDTSDPSDIAP